MQFIQPNWPAPAHIHAYTTTRSDGYSSIPYDKFNLAHHVGDQENNVKRNRFLLKTQLNLPSNPIWLNQIHSNVAIEAVNSPPNLKADASYTAQKNIICSILTADCLPILLTDEQGSMVAAIHAGWRGLVNGVIENTIKNLIIPASKILVWLGPAISQQHFEVGQEVYDAFVQKDKSAIQAFLPLNNHKWLACLYDLAKLIFEKMNIDKIFGGDFCTYTEKDKFYSYRRDGQKTGRMATLIWIS